ncbi:MAG TPA: STAS domain-containing protein [Actinomycetota bacterium]|nr:STAS domain-containing protein [Actinomycetota bacterium]
MEDFRVTTKTQDDWMVFQVEGDLDVYTSARLSTSLFDVIDKQEVLGVGVDLSRVNFMDSAGLSVIIRGHKRAQASQLGFRLINPRYQIRRILEVTDLVSLLAIEDGTSESASMRG